MNQEIKTKWVAALRSGEYEQGTKQLKKYEKFCCLGVLCDIHSKEKGIEWVDDGIYIDEDEFLSQDVMGWSGIKEINPPVLHGKFLTIRTLSSLNDSGYTFLQIADLIEAQL
jgi:hypothetical protein